MWSYPSMVPTGLDWFFLIWHKWSLACEGVVCKRLLTLAHIFKVIRLWLCKKNCQNIAHFVMSAIWHLHFCMDSFHIWHKLPLLWVCHIYTITWSWPISSRSFSHKSAEIWHILSCPLYSAYNSAWIFLYQAQITIAWGVLEGMTFDLALLSYFF